MEKKPENKNKQNPNNPSNPGDQKPAQPMRGLMAWAIVLGMIILLFQLYGQRSGAFEDISYSPEFLQLVEDGRIQTCEIISEASDTVYVQGKIEPEEGDDAKVEKKFKVIVKLTGTEGENLRLFLIQHGVQFKYIDRSPYLMNFLFSILPVVLIFGILYFLFMKQMRNSGGGMMGFGKSRAKMLNLDTKKVTFKNVAGIDEAQEEVHEIIDYLKDPKKFQKLGGRIPKGVLLMGPPGTGKTLLAKAIAGEADVPFFSISGSDFVEMFVGVGASRVRDMFDQGKKNAPCIIFIDEIDAVGRSRFTGIGGGHDEREQTLNALLVEMDGFETQEGVIILAATNRPDVLDQALLRPGRFDRQIVIDLPLIEGRESILKIHSRKIKLARKVDLNRLARQTPGFSGADLENLLNEAALLAARNNKKSVGMSDLEEARDKVKWGRERRSRKMDDKEKKNTAYHEAGHALIQVMAEESEPLHKVTIIPRGFYLGATMTLPDKDKYTEGKKKLLDELAIFMGGRVAEEIVFGDITTGASNDLKVSTQIARHMVCDWGMSEKLGPQAFGENQELMFLGREVNRSQNYSEETAKIIDSEVHRFLMEGHSRATNIITENRDKLDMIANLLLDIETIDGRDVEEIVEHNRVLSTKERDEIDKKKKEEEKAKKSKPKAEQSTSDDNPQSVD